MEKKNLKLSDEVLKLFKEQDPIQYGNEIKNIYQKHLYDIDTYTSIDFIHNQCGKIYEEISALNVSYGLWDKDEGYDHYLLFVIAGRVVTHHGDNIYIQQTTQEELAETITKQIMSWVEEQNK